jgi:hypothetical protein
MHSEYNTTQNNTTKAKYLQIIRQNTPTNRETEELTTGRFARDISSYASANLYDI